MTVTTGRDSATLSDLVAEEIRALLGRRRMSQAQLARQIGKSAMWVSDRLRGSQPIDLNDLERIADALGVSPLNLLPSTRRGEDATINQHSSTVGQTDDPKRVRHLSPRPFGPSRRDRNRPVSAIPATRRRPSPVRPGERAIAV